MSTLPSIINFMAIVGLGAASVLPQLRVTVKNGTLEGTTVLTRNERKIAAYKSIPYALPPVGPLRFKPPQPAEAWSGVRSAMDDVPICMQEANQIWTAGLEHHMTEDCLYLNVYAPLPEDSDGKKYPVMVWIHGGGFSSGSSHSKFYGPKFLLDQDIVLVAMNYRLGAFGFLSTGDSAAHGNAGLKDQVQALRWVHENIEAFGGDPNSVTIFGESAGAASVHHLMMSPLAQGLFHRAISQSGTSLNPWASYTRATARARASMLGAAFNCSDAQSEELISCLQAQGPREIIGVLTSWKIPGEMPLHFRPVVETDHEGALLVEDPIDAVKAGRVANVPWLNGVNSEEGCLLVAPLFGLQAALLPKINAQFSTFAPRSLLYAEVCPAELHVEVAQRMRKQYFRDETIGVSTRECLIDLASDLYFKYAHAVAIRESLKIGRNLIYFYEFKYLSNWSWSDKLGDPERNYGVCHVDDLQYLFPIREAGSSYGYLVDDYKMVDKMTEMWANFARTGKPTSDKSWKPVRTDALEQLVIEKPSKFSMKRDLWTDQFNFWSSLPCPAGLAATNKPSKSRGFPAENLFNNSETAKSY